MAGRAPASTLGFAQPRGRQFAVAECARNLAPASLKRIAIVKRSTTMAAAASALTTFAWRGGTRLASARGRANLAIPGRPRARATPCVGDLVGASSRPTDPLWNSRVLCAAEAVRTDADASASASAAGQLRRANPSPVRRPGRNPVPPPPRFPLSHLCLSPALLVSAPPPPPSLPFVSRSRAGAVRSEPKSHRTTALVHPRRFVR